MRDQLPPAHPERKTAHPWVIERIVHRAQPHLTETGIQTIPLWLLLGGVIVLMLIAFLAFYFWAGQALGVSSAPTEALRTPTAGVSTRVPVVASPALTSSAPTPARTGAPVAATPTPVPPSPVPVASPTRVVYKVKAGDTLSGIADRYGISVTALMRANNLRNEIIRIGDELIIPLPTPTPH